MDIENKIENESEIVVKRAVNESTADNDGPLYIKFRESPNLPNFSEDEDFPEDRSVKIDNSITLNNLDDNIIPPNDIIEPNSDNKKKRSKKKRRIILTIRLISLIPILYFFVCSLDLLTSGFQLLAGKTAGSIFKENSLLQNPIAGVMIGIIVTIFVQSSSTTTSIIVSMVSANILPVQYSIPMIMGANVGTSTTNTLVALGQIGVIDEFKRAFAGATIHDAFNWVNVLVQLPLEAATHFLYKLTDLIVKNINTTSSSDEPQFLNVITDPLTNSIIQINWTVVEYIAMNVSLPDNVTLRKIWCDEKIEFNETTGMNISTLIPCNYLLFKLNWPDWGIGLLLTILSLIILTTCLMLMVKNLRSLLEGKISKMLRKTIDKDFPGILKHLTPYVFILVGIGLTIIVQSSSVFTSALTPLVGTGVISLKRMYPLTLGSNIGTTITAIISAMAAPTSQQLKNSMQAALCHLFFNLFGIVIFFVIVPFRRVPMEMAKFFGRQTAKYKWFPGLYILLAFFVMPGVLLGLSIAGPIYALIVLIVFVIIIIAVCLINLLQKRKPKYLPKFLHTWNWLPEPLRSLAPCDRMFKKIRLTIQSIIQTKVIRPNISVTSMTHLFRNKNMSSDTLA